MSLSAVPITVKDARAFCARVHRKLDKAPPGARLVVGAQRRGELVGVVLCGNPVGRWDDGVTLEVNRQAVKAGEKNASSFLYATAARIARDLGWKWIVTYIEGDENGRSLRAAGFVCTAYLEPRESTEWNRSGRNLKLFENKGGSSDRFRFERRLSPPWGWP